MSAALTESQFRRLKQDVEDAKSEAERSRGAYDQLLHQLKEEFGCASVKDAKTLLSKLEAKAEKAEKEFQTALAGYERKWKT